MDYDALAREMGGVEQEPMQVTAMPEQVDYGALAAEMGGTVEEQPVKPAKEYEDISTFGILEDMATATANAGKAIYGGVKEAITGEERSTPETERLDQWDYMPEFNELSSLLDPAALKTSIGSLFTGSKGQLELIKANFPNMETKVDDKGNFFLKSKNGKWYANKPGFGPTDLPAAVLAAIPAGRVVEGAALSAKAINVLPMTMQRLANITRMPNSVLGKMTMEGLDAGGRLATADSLGADPSALDYAVDMGLSSGMAGATSKLSRNLTVRASTIKELDDLAVKASEHSLSVRKGGAGVAGGQEATAKLFQRMNDPRTQQNTLIYMDEKGIGFDDAGNLIKTKLNIVDEAGSAGALVHRPKDATPGEFSPEELARMRQAVDTDAERVAAAKGLGADEKFIDPLDLVSKEDKDARHVLKAAQDRAVAGDKSEELGTMMSEELQKHGADVNLGQLSEDTLEQMKGVTDNFKKTINKKYAQLYDTKKGGIDVRSEVDIPSTRELIEKGRKEQMPRLQAGEELIDKMDPKITAIEKQILADFKPRRTKVTEQLSDFGEWAGLDPDITEGSVGRTFKTLDLTRKEVGGMLADQTVSNYNKSRLTALYSSLSNDVSVVLDDMVTKGQITEKTRKLYDSTHEIVINQKMHNAKKDRLFGKDELAPLKAKLDEALKDATTGHGGALWDSILKDVPKNIRPKAIMSILHDSLDATSGGFVKIDKLHAMWSDLSQNKPLMNQLGVDIGPERMRGLRNVGILSEAMHQAEKHKSKKTKSYMMEIANERASRLMGVLTGLGVAAGTVLGSSAVAHGTLSQSKSYAATGIGSTLKKWLSGGTELRADYVTHMVQSPEFTKLLMSDMNDSAINAFTKKARVRALAKQRDKSMTSAKMEEMIKAGIRSARTATLTDSETAK
jgi:hypothetical protein